MSTRDLKVIFAGFSSPWTRKTPHKPSLYSSINEQNTSLKSLMNFTDATYSDNARDHRRFKSWVNDAKYYKASKMGVEPASSY
jgi:hypothetical protein